MTEDLDRDLKQIIDIGPQKYIQNHIHETLGYMRDNMKQILKESIRILAETIPKEADPLTRLRFLYEMVTGYVTYSYDMKEHDSRYSFASAILQCTAVCMGVSELMYLYGKALDLPIICVVGVAGLEGDQGLHAWNMVRLEDKWYHIDATHDLQRQGKFQYFLLTDEQIRSKWHAFPDGIYPRADTPHAEVPRFPAYRIQNLCRHYRTMICTLVQDALNRNLPEKEHDKNAT